MKMAAGLADLDNSNDPVSTAGYEEFEAGKASSAHAGDEALHE